MTDDNLLDRVDVKVENENQRFAGTAEDVIEMLGAAGEEQQNILLGAYAAIYATGQRTVIIDESLMTAGLTDQRIQVDMDGEKVQITLLEDETDDHD